MTKEEYVEHFIQRAIEDGIVDPCDPEGVRIAKEIFAATWDHIMRPTLPKLTPILP